MELSSPNRNGHPRSFFFLVGPLCSFLKRPFFLIAPTWNWVTQLGQSYRPWMNQPGWHAEILGSHRPQPTNQPINQNFPACFGQLEVFYTFSKKRQQPLRFAHKRQLTQKVFYTLLPKTTKASGFFQKHTTDPKTAAGRHLLPLQASRRPSSSSPWRRTSGGGCRSPACRREQSQSAAFAFFPICSPPPPRFFFQQLNAVQPHSAFLFFPNS